MFIWRQSDPQSTTSLRTGMPDLTHKPKCGEGLYASGLSLLKQSVCGVVGRVAGGRVLICEVLSVWCICVVWTVCVCRVWV